MDRAEKRERRTERKRRKKGKIGWLHGRGVKGAFPVLLKERVGAMCTVHTSWLFRQKKRGWYCAVAMVGKNRSSGMGLVGWSVGCGTIELLWTN